MFRLSLYSQTLLALGVGVVAGLSLGKSTAPLGVLATSIVNIIKWVAVPLVFLTIVETVARAEFRGAGVRRLFGVATVNGLAAIAIAILLVRIFQPGTYLPMTAPTGKKVGLAALTHFGEMVHGNPVAFFFQSPMVLAIISALTLGFGVMSARRLFPERSFAGFDRTASASVSVISKLLSWIVHCLPIAVFAAIAKVVGQSGLSLVGGLVAYVALCVGGMALQIAIVYQLWIAKWAKMPLGVFWREAREPAVHGFGINSSLVTLPLTLNALKRLRVSDASARLSACVGTNFNNDGILLYEVAAVFFLCQAYGVQLTILEQIITAFVCIVATIGVAGVPEAGVIALTLVLSAVGLPAESLTVLLTVDWIVARCRSFTNVTADMTVAIAIDAFEKSIPTTTEPPLSHPRNQVG